MTKKRRSMLTEGKICTAPEEVVALSRALTSEPIASSGSSTSVDRLVVSAVVSADAVEDKTVPR